MSSQLTSMLTSTGSTEVITTVAVTATPLPEVKCPSCGEAAEAWPGSSTLWVGGCRGYFSTWTVACPKCKREGFPSFYQGEENSKIALTHAVQPFLDRDSRPTLEYVKTER